MRKVAEVEEVEDMTAAEIMTGMEVMEALEVLRAEVTEVPEEDIKVLIIYSPMYGHIRRIAEDMKEGERT